MTMVGGAVPSLTMHQLSPVRRSTLSSRCSCCRIGAPPMVISLMSGRAKLLSPNDATAILDGASSHAGQKQIQRRTPSNSWCAHFASFSQKTRHTTLQWQSQSLRAGERPGNKEQRARGPGRTRRGTRRPDAARRPETNAVGVRDDRGQWDGGRRR